MTAPVDVLAVMDTDGRAVACVIDDCKSWDRAQKWKDHLTWHDEARAAVAELMEAAADVPVEYDFHGNPETPEWGRLVAALARCKGGAA